MMSAEVTQSIAAINNPKVVEAAKALAEFGLGVCVPHIHEGESVKPMPAELRQLEQDLVVSFVDKAAIPSDAFPVGFQYNQETNSMEAIAYCCKA